MSDASAWPLGPIDPHRLARTIGPKTFPLAIGVASNDGELPKVQLTLHPDGRIEGDLDGARRMLSEARGRGEMNQVLMWLLVRALAQAKGEIEG